MNANLDWILISDIAVASVIALCFVIPLYLTGTSTPVKETRTLFERAVGGVSAYMIGLGMSLGLFQVAIGVRPWLIIVGWLFVVPWIFSVCEILHRERPFTRVAGTFGMLILWGAGTFGLTRLTAVGCGWLLAPGLPGLALALYAADLDFASACGGPIRDGPWTFIEESGSNVYGWGRWVHDNDRY